MIHIDIRTSLRPRRAKPPPVSNRRCAGDASRRPDAHRESAWPAKLCAICSVAVAVGVALCPSTADLGGLAVSILWVAVALTVVSGLDIVVAAQRAGRAVT